MSILELIQNQGLWMVGVLILIPFIAGFIDSIVGGGGIIQLPVLFILFPYAPVAAIFGTNKIAAFFGTLIATAKYATRIRFNYLLLCSIGVVALVSSYFGAQLVSFVNPASFKPILFGVLILIGFYTAIKKDFGAARAKKPPAHYKKLIWGFFIGGVIGWYDGFIGPGTGSFLILAFIALLGFDFLKSSAYAKVINCVTNVGALVWFVYSGSYFLQISILMACANMLGNYVGSHLALKKGNGFVRILFLVTVSLMLIRFGYDIFWNN